MSASDGTINSNRRGFFGRMAALAGAVGTIALVRPRSPAQAAGNHADAPKQGYHLSEHIRKYYRKARI